MLRLRRKRVGDAIDRAAVGVTQLTTLSLRPRLLVQA